MRLGLLFAFVLLVVYILSLEYEAISAPGPGVRCQGRLSQATVA